MRELRFTVLVSVLLIAPQLLPAQPLGWNGDQPIDALHYLEQGNTYLDNGELDPAADLYTKALRLDPALVKAWYNLALTRYRQQEYALAEACLDTLFFLEPMQEKAYGLYGMTLYRRGFFDRAVKAFNFAIASDPDEDLYLARAMALIEAGEPARALRDFEQILRTRPGSITACMGNGAALMKMGIYHQAVTYFNRVIDLDPGHKAALTNRAICLAERGDHNGAERDFRQALENGAETATLLARARCRIQMKRYPAALDDIRSAMRLRPHDAAVYLTLGELELAEGRYQDALESFDVALDLHPECLQCLLQRSEAGTLSFQYKDAIADLHNALELEPGNMEAKEKLLWVYDQMDRKKR